MKTISDTKHDKINIKDSFDINGRVYFIPDKFVKHINNLGIEYNKLYKFMLASIIDNDLEKGIIQLSKITPKLLNTYVLSCEKIFVYIITGKINIVHFTIAEQKIINSIPEILIPKLNPNIVERLE